jgi:serine/threonine-protein kinase HipA
MNERGRERLVVFLQEERLGELERLGPTRYRFAYDQPIVARYGEGAVLLSASLPVRAEPYSNAQTKPFFEGLLPEGVVRREVARVVGISESNGFGLLGALGADCAGAVVVLPADASDPRPAYGEVRRLDPAEIEQKLHDLPRRPLGVAPDEGVRLSLAGVQQKLLLTRAEDGGFGQPAGGMPSTHILKPEQEAYPDLVVNEAFCLRVARCAGLEAARADVVTFGRITCLVVERYDRAVSAGGTITRLHQEDLCQALGVLPAAKYEVEGGPSITQVVALLRELGTARDLRAFALAVLVNFVLGNSDAHGKNFALLYEGTGSVRLAPVYDVVSTAVYDNVTNRLAMQIGGEDDPDRITSATWTRMLVEAGFRPSRGQLERDLSIVERCIDECLEASRAEAWHRPLLDRVAAVARERIRRLRA